MQFEHRRFPGIKAVRPSAGRWICEVEVGGGLFQFFMDIKPDASTLLVFGQGYTDRKAFRLPRFQRLNWTEQFDDSVIIINDPTLYLHPEMCLGWCLGTDKTYYLPIICDFIERIGEALAIPEGRRLFWGSSAGGFTSLMLTTHFPDAIAVVNNPQTDVLRFKRGGVQMLLKRAFGGITIPQAYERYGSRFSVLERLRSSAKVPKVYYLQNMADTDHYEDQFLPFLATLNTAGNEGGQAGAHGPVVADLYRDDVALHNPVGFQKTAECIRIAKSWMN